MALLGSLETLSDSSSKLLQGEYKPHWLRLFIDSTEVIGKHRSSLIQSPAFQLLPSAGHVAEVVGSTSECRQLDKTWSKSDVSSCVYLRSLGFLIKIKQDKTQDLMR